MTKQLQATPSFLLELISASQGLSEIEAAKLFENLQLNDCSILTGENVKRAQEGDETTKVERPVDPFAETKIRHVPRPETRMEEILLKQEEIPSYVHNLLDTDSSISIWAKEVIPIIQILQKEIEHGETVTPDTVLSVLKYYSKGNEPSQSDDFRTRLDEGEVIRFEEFQKDSARLTLSDSLTSYSMMNQ